MLGANGVPPRSGHREMNTKTMLRWLAPGLLAAGLAPAQAADFRPDALAVQAGAGASGTATAGVGLVWD
ncbi:MAG: hypothetical protein JWP41_2078, partial [Ramlibacter sp.]|nr:hypothetical protein [Ramlibacter sp.]